MSANTAPLISVVVPSFRMARFLPEMLESTLAQNYRPLEIVVVDGASDDGTVDVLRDYTARHTEIRWISERDSGPADAVNKGLAMARGEFVAIQNADDIYRPGALAAAVNALIAQPGASFVYGDLDGIDEDGRISYTRHFPDFGWQAFFALSCALAQSSIVIRRGTAATVGGWNGDYFSCDLDFWLRLALAAPPIHIPVVLSAWRRHAEQRTTRAHFKKIWDGYWRMIRDNTALRAEPLRVRKWALASRHLLAMRCYPTQSPWAIRGHVLLGLILHPTAWRYHPVERFKRLIPGRALYSRLIRIAGRVIPPRVR